MKILAIIPARSGSKGLVNKNLLPLMGHPLISYSIKAALESKFINKIIVSTDSESIAQKAKEYGAEVPFIRPEEFAQDDSLDLDVFIHALNWLKENQNYFPDYVIQLRPTSPIRKVEIIDEAIVKFIHSRSDSLRVVTQSPISPFKMWKIDPENYELVPLLKLEEIKEPYNAPRQSLPKTYWQIGTLDIIRPDVILKDKSMSGSKILPFVVSSDYAVDIDDLKSFEIASNIINSSNYIKFSE
jgi:CMP-N,N'-diacetyllegionaminic acid synthase